MDHEYITNNNEEEKLFQEKQKCMYPVFDNIILTDKGKGIVRDHEEDFDAQSVYKELKECCTKYTISCN